MGTAPEVHEVSDAATIDTAQEARHIWADEDGKFVTGAEALAELAAMAPLDRARINAALDDAKAMLKRGNWREAQGPLVTAEQIAAGVDARHVVRELLAHLRHLRAYMNRTNSPDSWKGQAGDREWPRMTVRSGARRHIPAATRRYPMSDTLSLSDVLSPGETEDELVSKAVVQLADTFGWPHDATWEAVRERAGGERGAEALAMSVADLYRDAEELALAAGVSAADGDDVAASAGRYNREGYADGSYVGELELSDAYPPEPAEAGWSYDAAAEASMGGTSEVIRLTAQHPEFFPAQDVAVAETLSGFSELELAAGLELASGGYDDPASEVLRLSMMADDMNARAASRSPAALKEARLSAIHDTTHERTARGHKRGCPPGCTRDHRQPRDGGNVHPEVERYLSMLHTRHPDGRERPHGNSHRYEPLSASERHAARRAAAGRSSSRLTF